MSNAECYPRRAKSNWRIGVHGDLIHLIYDKNPLIFSMKLNMDSFYKIVTNQLFVYMYFVFETTINCKNVYGRENAGGMITFLFLFARAVFN